MEPGVGGSPGSWDRTDWSIAALLFLLTVASRLPFRTTMLFSWDSILYARAIEQFDVTKHRPQPPGHILYVGAVWLADRVTGDPNQAMIWVSILASAAAAAALFWLGRMMLGRAAGAVAAILLVTSVSYWGHGEIAFPYTLLALLGALVAGLVWRTWEGRGAYLVPAALALGLAGGFRQDLVPFMFPLIAAGMVRVGSVRRAAVALITFVAASAAWYLPSALLSGGFSAYRRASSSQMDGLIEDFSVFGGRGLEALQSNLANLRDFLLPALAAATPLVIYLFIRLLFPDLRGTLRDRRFLFIILWMAPAALFYAFIHIGEHGYVFSIAPAFLLLAAWGLMILAADAAKLLKMERHRGAITAALAALAVLVNTTLFLGTHVSFSSAELDERDSYLADRVDAVTDRFEPDSTLIVSVFDSQHVAHYLPDYRTFRFDPNFDPNPVVEIDPQVDTVVIFEDELELVSEARREIPLSNGRQLTYVERGGSRNLTVDWGTRTVTLGPGDG